MPKMMMGQIDHARARIKEIKAEKLGNPPADPDVPGKEQLLEELLNGTVAVSPAQLKRAFAEFINQTPSDRINSTSRYSYSASKTVKKYAITLKTPESVDQALVNVVYSNRIAEEIVRWTAESREYDRIEKILNERANVVEDAIVLGDQAMALQALQEFAAFVAEDLKTS